jgi:hypothetical protein
MSVIAMLRQLDELTLVFPQKQESSVPAQSTHSMNTEGDKKEMPVRLPRISLEHLLPSFLLVIRYRSAT